MTSVLHSQVFFIIVFIEATTKILQFKYTCMVKHCEEARKDELSRERHLLGTIMVAWDNVLAVVANLFMFNLCQHVFLQLDEVNNFFSLRCGPSFTIQ